MSAKSINLALSVVANALALLLTFFLAAFAPQLFGDCGSVKAESHKINWQTSLAAAGRKAQEEHKYVIADVYTDWCGWCKKLDRDVFSTSEMVQYLQKDFVCVKVNAEDPREGILVKGLYKVDGYPCALIFSPEGKYIGRVPGYSEAKGYIATLDDITGRTDQWAFAKGPPSQREAQHTEPGRTYVLQPAPANPPSGGGFQPVGGMLPQQGQRPVRTAAPRTPQLTADEQMEQLQKLQQQWQQQNQQQQKPQDSQDWVQPMPQQ